MSVGNQMSKNDLVILRSSGIAERVVIKTIAAGGGRRQVQTASCLRNVAIK